MKMKQSELFVKFAACIKMVEVSGTDISLRTMVRLDGDESTFMPSFDSPDVEYTFAIGIIGTTPVFVGDTVYHTRNGKCVITAVDGYYVYYSVNGIYKGWNSYLTDFSLEDSKTIKLEDVKAFAIFKYNDQEVMILPAERYIGVPKYILSGCGKDFGVPFYSKPRTKEEMHEYLTKPNHEGGVIYVKTGKRFGLIEE